MYGSVISVISNCNTLYAVGGQRRRCLSVSYTAVVDVRELTKHLFTRGDIYSKILPDSETMTSSSK